MGGVAVTADLMRGLAIDLQNRNGGVWGDTRGSRVGYRALDAYYCGNQPLRFLHPDVVEAYDYIFIWDEDLDAEHFNAEKYVL